MTLPRKRSVIIDLPRDDAGRFWLTPEDKEQFPAERVPQIVRFGPDNKGSHSFGFLHHKVKYGMVVYAEVSDTETPHAELTGDAIYEVAGVKIYFHDGRAYLRAELTFDGSAEGVQHSVLTVTCGDSVYEIALNAQVLHDHQGHPVLSPGVHNLTHLHDAATDAGSEWPGFSHIPREEELEPEDREKKVQ